MKNAIVPQTYGASEIKSAYRKNLRKGLEFAIILHIALVSLYFVFNQGKDANADNFKHGPIDILKIQIGEPPSANEDEIVDIPKPKEDIKNLTKDLGALTPEPVSRKDAEQMTIKTQDDLDKIKGDISSNGDSVQWVNNGNNGNTKDIDNTIDTKIKIEPKIDDINKNYSSADVESIPECVNFDQVKASMVYPQMAQEIGLEGKVVVKVLVNAEGRVIKIGAITGPDVFHSEVKEKVNNLEFTPGLLNNKPVNVWVTVPFTFKLKN